MDDVLYPTFEAFRPHFGALARVAYFKIVKPISKVSLTLHTVYRAVVWMFVLLYNSQHIIRVILARHSTDMVVDTLFILLTTLNTLGKQVAFNARAARIDHILHIINSPLFAATAPYHAEVMRSNAGAMSRLLRLYHAAIFTCGALWTVFPLVNRARGEPVPFSAYFPFDTESSPVFEVTLAYMSILITFQAYGNVTMDCTIVSFYAQARTQLQMLRYDLEHLVQDEAEDSSRKRIKLLALNKKAFRDAYDKEFREEVQKRFAHCADHYQKIVWFVKEVESIFGEAMVVQFFVMAWVICMTMYKIVGLNLLSAEFFSMAMYLGCMLAQLFIYCYYGTQVMWESEFINQSIYCAKWRVLSPQFRRQLVVMMQYCTRPLMPRTAYIIPMSLETYIAVLRSSYTLFTFLSRKSHEE